MIVKEKNFSLRLTETERKKLDQDAASAKMTPSQYIRQLIAGSTPEADNGRQALVKDFCQLYKVIQEQKLDSNEDLMEGVEQLCRHLY